MNMVSDSAPGVGHPEQSADQQAQQRPEMGDALRCGVMQGICSPAFWIAVAAVGVLIAAGVWKDIWEGLHADKLLDAGYHLALVQKAMVSDVFSFALPIVCTLPCGALFLEELQSGYLKFYLPRTTKNGYVWGKAAGCMVCGGLCVVFGILLALGGAALFFTPFEKAREMPGGYLPDAGRFLQYLLLMFCLGAFWALIGMLLSVVTNSKYMAYISPFLIYYVLIILCERYMRNCYMLYPKEWIRPEHVPGGAYGVMLFLAEMAVGLCLVFYQVAAKKVSDL